jgi:hypothetical protein
MQYARGKGSEPDFSQQNHEAAHAAGFAWSDIEMRSWDSEESGEPARELFVQGVKHFMRDALITAGLATEEQMDEYSKLWEK